MADTDNDKPMTSHELARKLLELPDKRVCVLRLGMDRDLSWHEPKVEERKVEEIPIVGLL